MYSFPYKSSVCQIYLPDDSTRDKSGGEKIIRKMLFTVMDVTDVSIKVVHMISTLRFTIIFFIAFNQTFHGFILNKISDNLKIDK